LTAWPTQSKSGAGAARLRATLKPVGDGAKQVPGLLDIAARRDRDDVKSIRR
jgi:hypothetical protein